MIIENTIINTPIHTLYSNALATHNHSILNELSMPHVISVFQEYITQDENLDLIQSKFGVLLLQRTATPTATFDMDFFLPDSGLSLCYFLLYEIVFDHFWEMMRPAVVTQIPTDDTMDLHYICTAEQEQILYDHVSPYLKQFPLTGATLFDSVINYPQRLYI